MSDNPTSNTIRTVQALIPLITLIAVQVRIESDKQKIEQHNRIIADLKEELKANHSEFASICGELNKQFTNSQNTYTRRLEEVTQTIIQS